VVDRIQDAKILAGLVSEPAKVTAAQMELWVRNFDNWEQLRWDLLPFVCARAGCLAEGAGLDKKEG